MKKISERNKAPRTEIQKYWSVMTLYERFEHIVAIILSSVITIIILMALLQLVREVINIVLFDMLNPLEHQVFKVVFGMIMTLLIAMEFKHSILTVLHRRAHIVQARAVIMIALLALSRKLIILDFANVNAEKLAALGLVILILGIVYYLLHKINKETA